MGFISNFISGTQVVCIIACCAAGCSASQQLTFAWNYDDMVGNCKAWLSVQVRTVAQNNVSQLHNVTVTLSTSDIVDKTVLVHTDVSNFEVKHRAPCLYHSDFAYASEIRGLVHINFEHDGTWYRASTQLNSTLPAQAEVFNPLDEAASRCHFKVPPPEQNEPNPNVATGRAGTAAVGARHARGKRSLNLGSFQGATVTKVLELVLVLDSSFIASAGGETAALDRALQITSYANGIYQPLSLRIVLTHIIIWTTDEIPISSNSEITLIKFTAHKAMNINIRHDIVILLSSVQLDNGYTLGVAWLQSACNRIYSSGLVADVYQETISTGLVLAHEIGHNLGFEHMEDANCDCSSDYGCVMNSYQQNRLRIQGWSNCTLDSWHSQANATWRSCLADAPAESYHTTRSPLCGNGILETGEQCDCGPVETCSTNCCNARTCRLKTGATCASGPCCDWNTCRMKPKGHVCRAAGSPCDVPETCSGSSEWCPSDDKVADGVDCAAGEAYCHNGHCRTRDIQCQRLFRSSARSASSVCFDHLNVLGRSIGHCSSELTEVSKTTWGSMHGTYSYKPCSRRDASCGLLHCSDSDEPHLAEIVYVGDAVCYSQSHVDLTSSGLRSPSLVPDGAACRQDSMCVNSTCVPLSTIRYRPGAPDCGNGGRLTQAGLCFCEAGFQPPNCIARGCGGSLTSPMACPESTE